MGIYDRMQAMSLKLLTSYGGPMTYERRGPSIYDPATGKNAPTQQAYGCTAAIFDYSQVQPAISTMKGSEIQQGDKIIYMALQGTLAGAPVMIPKPDTNDCVIDASGFVYNVQEATTIDPSGASPVLHILHARGVPQ